MKSSRISKGLGPYFILAILVIAVGTMGTLEYKQWRKRRLIQQEIKSLQEQQRTLQGANKELEDSLAFLDTQNYQEKFARQQLNLKEDGEIVVNFETPQVAEAPPTPAATETNAHKWWRYFFINH